MLFENLGCEIMKYCEITSPKRPSHVVSISKFDCLWKFGFVEMNFHATGSQIRIHLMCM